MISLVSKINPSPDWILGVASMELCTENCRWIDGKVLNLYPWDAGTDAGPSYMVCCHPLGKKVLKLIAVSFSFMLVS